MSQQLKMLLKVFSLRLVVTLQSQPHECLVPRRLEVSLMTQNQLAEREREKEKCEK